MTPEIEILRKSNNHEIKAEMKSHETKSHKYVFKRGNDDITVYFFKSNQIKSIFFMTITLPQWALPFVQ